MRLKGVIFSPSERCYDPDELVAQLKSGTYSFNKPEYAYTNESFNVVLLLKTADGQDVISRFRGLQGSREERIAPVAQYLEATLRGADFKIDPSAPQPQSITTQAPVEWHWSVTPLKSGDKMLIIDVFADLQIGAEKHHVQLKVLEVPIQIRVDTLQWIKSAFTEASGFIVALAAALTALIGAISPLRHWVLRLFRRT